MLNFHQASEIDLDAIKLLASQETSLISVSIWHALLLTKASLLNGCLIL